MKQRKAIPKWLKALFFIGIGISPLLFWQNCSDVRLSSESFLSIFKGRGLPFDILPPTDYKIHRRVVVMVDMSNSMISGPCPYDIDNAPYAPMFTKDPHAPYDPNKGTGDKRDGRALAWDCQVRSEINSAYGEEKNYSSSITPYPDYSSNPPSKQFATYVGIDPAADRLKIAQAWLDQLNGNLSAAAKSRVKVSIVPVTGGRRQFNMLSKVDQVNGTSVSLKLLPLVDPQLQVTLDTLKNEHNSDLAQVMLPDYFRWDKTTMGTTSPGDLLDDLYRTIRADMESLIPIKALPFARYDVLYLSDGRVRPKVANFTDALNLLPMCASCAANPASCTGVVIPPKCEEKGDKPGSGSGGGGGPKCEPVYNPCAKLVDEMRESWGNPETNSDDALELEWSMIEGMPRYYGGGLLKVGLVKLKPTKVQQVSAPGEGNSFDVLGQRFHDRGLKLKVLEAPDDKPPIALANAADEIKVFKLTHMYMYNNNARVNKAGLLKVDTDGDGLFDEEEAQLGTNPRLQRTQGACLDIIATNPAYVDICKQFAEDHTCGATFDADHDDLNECDERAIGTDDRDFDTDGDGIPDSLEVVYGFNPTVADTNLDTNGDGSPNPINFAAGLSPQTKLADIASALQVRYRVDYLGSKTIPDEDFVQVRIDQYSVHLDNVPTLPTVGLSATSQGDLYLLPESRLTPAQRPLYRIHPDLRLLGFPRDNHSNLVTVIARIVDPREPEIVFWRLYRMRIQTTGLNASAQIDNSAFQLLPAVDYDSGGTP